MFSVEKFYRLPQGWISFWSSLIRESGGHPGRVVSCLKVVEWVARWTWGTCWDSPHTAATLTTDEFRSGRRGPNGERLDHGAGIRHLPALLAALRMAEDLRLLVRETTPGHPGRFRLRLEEPPESAPEAPETSGFPVFRPSRYFAVPMVWNDLRPDQPPGVVLVVEALMELSFSFRGSVRAWRSIEELAALTGLHPERVRTAIARAIAGGMLVWRPAGPVARSFALRLRGDQVDEEGRLIRPSEEALQEEREALEELLRRHGIARAAALAAELQETGWSSEALRHFLAREGAGSADLPPGLLVARLRSARPPDPEVGRRDVVESWQRLSSRRPS